MIPRFINESNIPKTDTKVVLEKMASCWLVAKSQCGLSGHPSKYWPRAALFDFGDRQSHAPTVKLPVSVFFYYYYL